MTFGCGDPTTVATVAAAGTAPALTGVTAWDDGGGGFTRSLFVMVFSGDIFSLISAFS